MEEAKRVVRNAWYGIRSRCSNPNNQAWDYYGGRGITFHPAWLASFEAFYAYVGPKPSPAHTIDRMDNDGNYVPGNVRWATRREQAANRRNTRFVVVEGVKYVAADLARINGIKPETVQTRALKGLGYEEVISKEFEINTSGLACGAAVWSEMSKKATHCRKGHEFTEANTYFTREGWKRCRVCHNAKMRRYAEAKRNIS